MSEDADDVNEEEEEGRPRDFFPWPDVTAAREDRRLQRRHAEEVARARRGSAAVCPACGAGRTALDFFYFESPPWTWRDMCGRAGVLAVCDPCHRQVDFAGTVMN